MLFFVFYFDVVFSLFFLIIFSFLSFFDYSWNGLFFLFDSFIFLFLIFMSIFILSVIVFSENNYTINVLSLFLIFVSILFFISSNFFFLYIFFEMSMFVILIMIVGFGSQIEKINSSFYLIFYSLFCSFPFLFIYFSVNFIFSFCYYNFIISWEYFFFLSLCFLMKFPVYFLHLWLPKAHVEAPTSASMLLAGLLLKLGTAGFLRITYSFSFVFVNFWIFIAFIGMILCSFLCIFQSDSKALAAYSSITHMSFLLLSMCLLISVGKSGGFVMMIAHGYTSTLLFFFIGLLYHEYNTRMVYFLNSFMSSCIPLSMFFILMILSNGGIPPSLSFFSEILVIFSGFIMMKAFGIFLFLYFLVSFYYSIYFMSSVLMGDKHLSVSSNNLKYTCFMVIMMFNFFYFSFYY